MYREGRKVSKPHVVEPVWLDLARDRGFAHLDLAGDAAELVDDLARREVRWSAGAPVACVRPA
jgi:hypothetical protein